MVQYPEIIFLQSELIKCVEALEELDLSDIEEAKRLDSEVKRLRSKIISSFPDSRFIDKAKKQLLLVQGVDMAPEDIDKQRSLVMEWMQNVIREIDRFPKY